MPPLETTAGLRICWVLLNWSLMVCLYCQWLFLRAAAIRAKRRPVGLGDGPQLLRLEFNPFDARPCACGKLWYTFQN
jgi:hypothetical protein